jgi:hypothetical protein
VNPIFVRPIQPNEGQLFLDWSLENKDKNEFDPQVPLYPASVTWCAYDKTGPVAFQTIQRPAMLESLAPRPGLDSIRISSALRELTQNAITQAHLSGAGEIYFLGSDEKTNEFATNHIFEEVPLKVYRVKLADLLAD